VKGINLADDDEVVGMVVADPEYALLTICEHGYGKRTPFGLGDLEGDDADGETASEADDATGEPEAADEEAAEGEAGPETRSGMRYRRQRRGGKGLRDIKTT